MKKLKTENANETEGCLLTIIVPSYKTAPYIDMCLPTFINNELKKKIKVLLIDDGTPDKETKEKLIFFAKTYPDFFEFIHKGNGGHGSVINLGAALSQSKYFKVIDGDDWVNTKELVNLVRFLQSCIDDIVFSDFSYIYTDHKVFVSGANDHSTNFYVGKNIDSIENFTIVFHNETIKTSLWKNNGIAVRENVFYDDQEYCLYPLEYAKTVAYCPGDVYQYRIGEEGQSVSPASRGKHFEDLVKINDDLYDLYLRNLATKPFLSKNVAKAITNNFFGFLISAMYTKGDSRMEKIKKKDEVGKWYRLIVQDPILYAELDRKRSLFKTAKALHFKHFRLMRSLFEIRQKYIEVKK